MIALSLIGAPLLYRAIGLSGLFLLNGALCLLAMLVVKYLVPDPQEPARKDARPGAERGLLDIEQIRLNAGIFILHIVLYAMFVVVPPLLVHAGLDLSGATALTFWVRGARGNAFS